MPIPAESPSDSIPLPTSPEPSCPASPPSLDQPASSKGAVSGADPLARDSSSLPLLVCAQAAAPASQDSVVASAAASADHPVPAPKPKESLTLHSAIGTVDLRTPEEDVEFRECETVVREGWNHFAKVGEALTRIRDRQLYKNEYPSFEIYCHQR
jgi:hypothetical protein